MRQTAQATASPPALLQQADDTLASLATAQPLYRAERDETLALQAAVARTVAQCEDVRTRVLEAQDWKVLDAAFETNHDPLAATRPRDPQYDRLFTRIVMEAPEPIGLGPR